MIEKTEITAAPDNRAKSLQLQSQSSGASLPSDKLLEVLRILDRDVIRPMSGISVREAVAAVDFANRRLERATEPDEAASATERLMTFCSFRPSMTPEHVRVATMAMTATFAGYPLGVVKAVCDPVSGLPATLKWPITQADLIEALNNERGRLERVRRNASVIIEAARERAKEAERDRIIEAERAAMTPEQRAEYVNGILARLRSISDAKEQSEGN